MSEPTSRGFHLLEESSWEETSVLPKIVPDEDLPRSPQTPVMPSL